MPFIRNIKFYLSSILIFTALFILSACSGDQAPVKGFVLPEGDVAQGQQVFLDFNCHGCHTIPELNWICRKVSSNRPSFWKSEVRYTGLKTTGNC